MVSKWWHLDGAPTPDEWMAIFAGATLVVAVVAACVALAQLKTHLDTARTQTRPYVVVDFTFRSILMGVEIKNFGATPASDISLRVDPPFQSRMADRAKTLNAVFAEPEKISMLVPGRRILYILDRASDYHQDRRPTRYDVTVTYSDLPEQCRCRPKVSLSKRPCYEETYTLDFRQWSKSTAETDYENQNLNIAKRQEKRAERQTKAIEKLVDTVAPPPNDEAEIVPAASRDVIADDTGSGQLTS